MIQEIISKIRFLCIYSHCRADNWSEDDDGNINNGTLGGLTAFGEVGKRKCLQLF